MNYNSLNHLSNQGIMQQQLNSSYASIQSEDARQSTDMEAHIQRAILVAKRLESFCEGLEQFATRIYGNEPTARGEVKPVVASGLSGQMCDAIAQIDSAVDRIEYIYSRLQQFA